MSPTSILTSLTYTVRNFIMVGFILSALPALAAPIPFTSSSQLISEKNGIYRSPLGFSIHAGTSGWKPAAPTVKNDFVVATYKSDVDSSALTVRIDEIKKPITLDEYSKKWLKDYPRFGFDVLTAKKVRVGKEIGYMLDFVSPENKKQLRQILFVKNKNAVTLTCRGEQVGFSKTVRQCNEIIRNFKWN
ncbi:MAG: hypothetical protein AABZ31_06600 [Bdellovibrionota bacterium]